MEAFESSQVRRYSSISLRFLIAVLARRTRPRVNAAASLVLVKPLVVMAARVLGPGPTRLKLVKLAHNLGPNKLVVDEHPPPGQPTQRAA